MSDKIELTLREILRVLERIAKAQEEVSNNNKEKRRKSSFWQHVEYSSQAISKWPKWKQRFLPSKARRKRSILEQRATPDTGGLHR